MKNKKEVKSMKFVFAMWVWYIGSPPETARQTWQVKTFGSESKAKTWLAHNSYQLFQAEGVVLEIECEADIPPVPVQHAKLYVGDRESDSYHRAGRYPALDKSDIENKKHVRYGWEMR